MGYTRSFVEDDIPQVARLHRTVFKTGERVAALGLDSYHEYFKRVFLDNPSGDPSLPSLVYEDDEKRIVGFMGVVPRRIRMNGKRFQAAISTQFVVDAETRAGLIAVRLSKAFLEGPQDLSITDEATDIARKIWEGLGGRTALLHSLHWTRPVRPARLALALLRQRAGLAPLALAGGSVAPLIDALATRLRHSQLRYSRPEGSATDTLTARAVLTSQSAFVPSGSLHVEYDEQTLSWLLECARRRGGNGAIRAAVVRKDQRIMGYYVYHLDEAHVASVLHIGAQPDAASDVLDHLLYQASQDGAIAATGRLEPRYLQILSDKYCVFHRRGPWLLLKARNADILRSFETGDAFFSRLDGEWCLGF